MNQAANVTATFSPIVAHTLTVNVTGTGTGWITSTSTGISCPNDCTEDYLENASVTLTSTPTVGSVNGSGYALVKNATNFPSALMVGL